MDRFFAIEDGKTGVAQINEGLKVYEPHDDDQTISLYKVTNDPPVGKSEFKTYGDLPSDHYLWLVGEAAKMVRGETPPAGKMRERK